VLYGAVAARLAVAPSTFTLQAQTFPQYNHIFLIVMESEPYNVTIGNQYVPILNALAQD
jgi:hypothetical protein